MSSEIRDRESIGTVRYRESTGSVDGNHHEFRCSTCDAPLADIWVNYPNDNIEWNFVAECCHCGDKSYEQKVHGVFVIGQTEEGRKYTVIEDYTLDADPIVIKTKQIQPFRK